MTVLSLGGLLSALLTLFVLGTLLVVVLWAIVDVVRRADLSGAKKALWVVFLLIFPLIGVVIYVAVDVLRRPDLSGGRKVLWLAFLVFVSVIAVPVYIIVNRGSRPTANAIATNPTPADKG